MPAAGRSSSLLDRLRQGVEQRTGLRSLFTKLRQHTVPARLPWYAYLGGLLLFFLGIQTLTGILLLFYYQPSPATAHGSIEQIMGKVRFGWIVRGLHYWASHAMVITLALHLVRVFFTASFKRPREITWMLGVGLLIVVLGFGFTGSLLPWDQSAFWGATVGVNIAGQTPWIGPFLRALLRGGRHVGAATLERFFALHVIVLPGAIVALLAAHLALVWKHGPSHTPSNQGHDTGMAPFFPVHARKEAALACFVAAALLLWVAWLPAPLGEAANPLATPENVKPLWYFLFSYQALKFIPSLTLPGGLTTMQLAVLAHAVPVLGLLLWPFIERSPEPQWRRRRPALLLACLMIAALSLLTYLGAYAGGAEPLLGWSIP